MADSRMTVAGFFAGVGGIETGFEKAGFDTTWANERDKYAAQTFRENHKGVELAEQDIEDLAPWQVGSARVWTGGFPCQPFSVAGMKLGFQDERGNAFFALARLVEHHLPEVLLLENVKNLASHDGGRTFQVILNTLNNLGYYIHHRVLNARDYGVPQNRERVFIVAFRDPIPYIQFEWPEPIPLDVGVMSILDDPVDNKYHYSPEKFAQWDMLEAAVVDPDVAYQWRRRYVRANKTGVFPTLTANMGAGGHNVPLVLQGDIIRKITPRECFRVQGYDDISLPKGMSDAQLYKQAGNSVSVPVVTAIALSIKECLLGD